MQQTKRDLDISKHCQIRVRADFGRFNGCPTAHQQHPIKGPHFDKERGSSSPPERIGPKAPWFYTWPSSFKHWANLSRQAWGLEVKNWYGDAAVFHFQSSFRRGNSELATLSAAPCLLPALVRPKFSTAGWEPLVICICQACSASNSPVRRRP